MALGYHKTDYGKMAAEDEIMEAFRKANVPPGEYMFPRPASREAMKEPEFVAKMNKGPLGLLTLKPGGPVPMGKTFFFWYVYCAVVSLFSAYVAGHALGPGAPSVAVLRFAGTTAFAAYALGLWQNTIWYWRSAALTIKSTIDGAIYAAITGAILAWLWPAV